jgi:phage protein D
MTKAPLIGLLLVSVAGLTLAKLPAPSDEAKAKAAATAAKTAYDGKLANYQLCMSMDKVATAYRADAKKAGKEAKPATATPACDNPGPFVYVPPASAPAASAAVAAAAAAPKK